MTSARQRGSVAAKAALGSIALAGLALAPRMVLSSSSSFSSAAAFVFLLGAALAWWSAVSTQPRVGVIATFTVLGWGPFVFLGAVMALGEPIVTSSFRCGTALMGMLSLAPFVVIMVLAFSALFAVFAGPRRALDPIVRALAIGGTAVGLLAVGLAIAHVRRPDPDRYLASLAPVEHLSIGETKMVAGRELAYVLGKPGPEGEQRCELRGVGEISSGATRLCPSLVLLQDASADLFIVRDDTGGYHLAFKGSTFVMTDVTVSQVASNLAPPLGWTIGTVLAVIGALALLGRSRKMRRGARALEGAFGVHGGGGWVTTEDGKKTHVPAAESLPEGPVTLEFHAKDPGSPYRDPALARVRAVTVGTLEEQRVRIRDRAASFDAVALATVGLGILPLLVTRLLGF